MLTRIVALCALLLLGCQKSSEKTAYEEIVATMSMEKARRFFDHYPRSEYRQKLGREIASWCKKEGTRESYEMVLNALPRDAEEYGNLAACYRELFAERQRKAE
jgi:hypothetical protein